MDPLTIGMITGGANLIGSIFSSNTSAQNTQAQLQAQQAFQQESEKFNAGQAQINRDFQANQVELQRQYETTMSNTAYQRSRQDMIAAGLNPMVMAGMGGASTPQVSAASGGAASVGTPQAAMPTKTSLLAGLGSAAKEVVNSAVAAQTFNKMVEETANVKAQAAKTAADQKVSEGVPAVQAAQIALLEAQKESEKRRPALIGAQTGEAAAGAGLKTEQTETQKQVTLSEEQKKLILKLSIPGHQVTASEAAAIMDLPPDFRKRLQQGAFVGNKVGEALKPGLSIMESAASIFRKLKPW